MKALFLFPLLLVGACTEKHLDVCKYAVQTRQLFTATLAATGAAIDKDIAQGKPVPKDLQRVYDTTNTALIALNASCPVTTF